MHCHDGFPRELGLYLLPSPGDRPYHGTEYSMLQRLLLKIFTIFFNRLNYEVIRYTGIPLKRKQLRKKKNISKTPNKAFRKKRSFLSAAKHAR